MAETESAQPLFADARGRSKLHGFPV